MGEDSYGDGSGDAGRDATEAHIEEPSQKRANVEAGGGKARIDKQHASKKLTSRERIEQAGRS